MTGKDVSNNLSRKEFLDRAALRSDVALRADALATENVYRELFARQRDSWEIPEVADDPHVFLVNVFENAALFTRVSEAKKIPTCFTLTQEARIADGQPVISSQKDFTINWECFTEGLLRFVEWENVFCAGGSVAGCLALLPKHISSTSSISASRVQRRKYFHDSFLPSSDIDLFLYSLSEEQAQAKLLELYDAVQAACPYEIRAVRSAHAVTFISQYPFRHVQVILRVYNSPAEILMGFDVDACAVGYDGTNVYACPRTVIAMKTQSNTVDMTRRSPSYEMRLAKYGQRGFEVLVPELDRDRVDPFLYEKRFDQTKGLTRLLLLESLKTPEARFRYRIKGQLKNKRLGEWEIQRRIRKAAGDVRNIGRLEGTDGIVIPSILGEETSNYSTVFLPWGPQWTSYKIVRLIRQKDKILNRIEILSNGHVIKNRRPYKLHVCAVGTMAELVDDPFPDDPPLPEEVMESAVHGKLTWLVDNPGRQQIGSFHPITTEDWHEGAYISKTTEDLLVVTIADDVDAVSSLLESNDEGGTLLMSRDFLGRSALHVAALAGSTRAAKVLLLKTDNKNLLLSARLADGRTALHVAAMRGNAALCQMILEKRKELAELRVLEEEEPSELDEETAAVEILDIDGADWEVKMNPLQYAVVLGHVDVMKVLLEFGASARKVAVHKDRNESLSALDLVALYASEAQDDEDKVCAMMDLLVQAGASPAQVDTHGSTCWHRFTVSTRKSSLAALGALLDRTDKVGGKAKGIDILDSQMRTPLYMATACGNSGAVALLLKNGATVTFSDEKWEALKQAGKMDSVRYWATDESKRCPVLLAASNADGPCLEVFLAHDKSLANVEILVGAPDNRFRQDRSTEFTMVRPLDYVEKASAALLAVKKHDANHPAQQNARRFEIATERSAKAESTRDSYPKTSYEYFVWSVVAHQLNDNRQEILAQIKTQTEQLKMTPESEVEWNEANEQVVTARKLLQDAGAIATTGTKTPDPIVNRRSQPSDTKDTSIRDPWHAYANMNSIPFKSALSMPRYGRIQDGRVLSPGMHKVARNIMETLWKGDIEKMQTANIGICFVDSVGVTPLFAAALVGNIVACRKVYSLACDQYKRFVQQKNKVYDKEEEMQAETAEAETDTLLKDQVRRLQSLDILKGEGAGEILSPDLMRHRLEAAEEKATKQEKIVSIAVSAVTPESLLLYRSVVLPEQVPEVAILKRRLEEHNPNGYSPNFVDLPVRLRPIEMAVLKSDLALVRALQELEAMSTRNVEAIKKGAAVCEAQAHSDSDDSEDEGLADSDGTVMTDLELRYAVYGDASRNKHLGSLSLLELAIVVDDVSIYVELLSRAHFYALPRAAVKWWKMDVDSKLETDDKMAKNMRDATTSTMIATNYWDSHYVSEWSTGSTSQGRLLMVHPTPLQFALAVGSTNHVEALLAGGLQDAFLGCTKGIDFALTSLPKKDSSGDVLSGCFLGAITAAAWASEYVKDNNITVSEILFKLFSAAAPDALGRTALFYATLDKIEDVVESATASMVGGVAIGGVSSDPRDSFLNAVTRKGSISALMAAASAGDADRVKTLLRCGCSRALASGSNRWTAFHLAIPNKAVLHPRAFSNINESTNSHTDPWNSARTIFDILLEGATEEEKEAALIAPQAEHTPLMLAADRGADHHTLKHFMDKLAGPLLDRCLAARDSKLNSTLQLAVSNCIASEQASDGVRAILSQSDALPSVGPHAENLIGVTPFETVLYCVCSPWARAAGSKQKSLIPRRGFLGNYGNQRDIPPKPSAPEKTDDLHRDLLSLLNEKDGKRAAVKFEEVKQAKDAANRRNENSNQEQQCCPTGLPVVLSQSLDNGRQHAAWQEWV